MERRGRDAWLSGLNSSSLVLRSLNIPAKSHYHGETTSPCFYFILFYFFSMKKTQLGLGFDFKVIRPVLPFYHASTASEL